MTITINHTEHTVADNATVADAMTLCGPDTAGRAVALGSHVIPRARWSETPLAPGDALTVIQAVCGG